MFLDELVALVPSTPIRVMVGMAEGADMLVARAALERNIAVDAVLPMPLEYFASDFGPAGLAELQRLLAHPGVTHVVLDPPAELPERFRPLPAQSAIDCTSHWRPRSCARAMY